jgi:hypothetical protein
VRLPSAARYWTVIDDELRKVPVADAYLRNVRFGRDDAESTSKSYARAVALYLTWCGLKTGKVNRRGCRAPVCQPSTPTEIATCIWTTWTCDVSRVAGCAVIARHSG